MGKQGVFRVLLIVGIISNLAVLISFASSKKVDISQISWQSYLSQSARFSVAYPKDWKVVESGNTSNEKGLVIKFSRPRGAKIIAYTSLKGDLLSELVKPTPFSRESPLKLYHEINVTSAKFGSVKFKESPTTQAKIAGNDALVTPFESKTWSGMMGRSMKGQIVTTFNGDSPITFKMICPVGQYEEVSQIFNICMAGFKPAAKTEAPAPSIPGIPGNLMPF